MPLLAFEYDFFTLEKPLAEYVWLGSTPIAFVQSEQNYHVHVDHLGTPKVLTDASGQVGWRADYSPFGKASITSQGPTFNLRFPGQYYDAETGLHYNWHRYYDPETGRYISSDPIGLAGGINTYAYALSNPVALTDPTGLRPPGSIAGDFGFSSGLPSSIPSGQTAAVQAASRELPPNQNPFGQYARAWTALMSFSLPVPGSSFAVQAPSVIAKLPSLTTASQYAFCRAVPNWAQAYYLKNANKVNDFLEAAIAPPSPPQTMANILGASAATAAETILDNREE